MNKAYIYFKSKEKKFDQTYGKYYNVIQISYENILHGVSSDIDFIMYMLMI
jgi:hypothetical protein